VSPLAFGLLCFSSLFTVIDPVSTAPIFVATTRGTEARARRKTLLRACVAALVALVVFAIAGSALLKIFGVTIDAFRIAGGILFVGMALPMLRGAHAADESESAPRSAQPDPGVVPLGIPLIAGPGAMTTVMVLMGQTTSAAHVATFFGALLLAVAATGIVLAVAPRVVAKMGPSGLDLVTRVMGLVVLVIGVQFVIDGVRPVALDLVRAARAV
jgi:multiple antibiotic resistance protein